MLHCDAAGPEADHLKAAEAEAMIESKVHEVTSVVAEMEALMETLNVGCPLSIPRILAHGTALIARCASLLLVPRSSTRWIPRRTTCNHFHHHDQHCDQHCDHHARRRRSARSLSDKTPRAIG